MTELEIIKKETEKYFGFDLSTKKRDRRFVKGRWVYYKLCKTLLKDKFSFASVGKSVNRDHATVIHGINNFYTYKDLQEHYEKLRYNLNNILELGIKEDEVYSLTTLRNEIKHLKIELNSERSRNKYLTCKYNEVKHLGNNKCKYEAINKLLSLEDEQIQFFIETRLNTFLRMLESQVTNKDLIQFQKDTRKM